MIFGKEVFDKISTILSIIKEVSKKYLKNPRFSVSGSYKLRKDFVYDFLSGSSKIFILTHDFVSCVFCWSRSLKFFFWKVHDLASRGPCKRCLVKKSEFFHSKSPWRNVLKISIFNQKPLKMFSLKINLSGHP